MNKQPRKTDRRGAVIVEMALVLPIFFMVVLGIIEFGRGMMVSQMVTNSAREGARLAMYDGSTNSEVEQTITGFLQSAVGVSSADVNIVITVTPAPGNPDPGNLLANAETRDLITVRVEVPFDKVSYLAGEFLSGKKLVGQSALRHE